MDRRISKDSLVMERGVQKGPVGEVIYVVDEITVRVLWSDGREGSAAVDSLVVVRRAEGEGR